jgi:hypothetical protein
VLLATSAETGLSEAIDDSCSALLIVVLLGDVVVLALERLPGGVLALSLDDADAGSALDHVAEVRLVQTLLLLGGEVLHDGRQRSRGQTRVGELVDDVVGNDGVGLIRHLGGFGSRGRHARR